jgi:hypothetical protein
VVFASIRESRCVGEGAGRGYGSWTDGGPRLIASAGVEGYFEDVSMGVGVGCRDIDIWAASRSMGVSAESSRIKICVPVGLNLLRGGRGGVGVGVRL